MSRMPSSHPLTRWRAAVALPVAVALLAGCVVVPRTTETYDRQCRIVRRQMTLEAQAVGHLSHCGRDCALELAAVGVVAAASLVISGSIAVVGNVAYWLEHRGRCPGLEADTDADFARAAAAAAASPASAATGPASAAGTWGRPLGREAGSAR